MIKSEICSLSAYILLFLIFIFTIIIYYVVHIIYKYVLKLTISYLNEVLRIFALRILTILVVGTRYLLLHILIAIFSRYLTYIYFFAFTR